MSKRVLISALWFTATWGVGGLFHITLDVPRGLMVIPALAVAAAWWVGLGRYETWVAQRHRAVNGHMSALMAVAATSSAADA